MEVYSKLEGTGLQHFGYHLNLSLILDILTLTLFPIGFTLHF